MSTATYEPGGALRTARKKERPEPLRRSVTRRDVDGNELGPVDLEPTIFGIEPNLAVLHQVVTAQLAAPARAPSRPRPVRSAAVAGQALPPEGHRPGPRRLLSLTHLGGRWRRPRPEAPQLRPEDTEEDGCASPCARPCRTAPAKSAWR